MPHEVIYREAVPADVLKLSVLYKVVYIQTYGVDGVSDEFANFIARQFSVERLSDVIAAAAGNLIVAEYKGNLVGVAEIEFSKKCPVGNIVAPELNKLYILDWFCRKGIGEGLLREAEKRVITGGANEMWLWVLESNARAIAFYTKHHFEPIGNAPFQMEVNKYENVVMFKRLEQRG